MRSVHLEISVRLDDTRALCAVLALDLELRPGLCPMEGGQTRPHEAHTERSAALDAIYATEA